MEYARLANRITVNASYGWDMKATMINDPRSCTLIKFAAFAMVVVRRVHCAKDIDNG